MQRDLLEKDLKQYLSREEYQALQNKRFGVFIFQLSWILAFVCLVIVNWQMRFSPQWMPPGGQGADVLLATFSTAALGLSAWLVWRGQMAVRLGQLMAFRQQWLAALGLAGLFMVVIGYEWLSVSPSTQYGQVFRLMTGFHMFHALAIGVYLWATYRGAEREQYGPHHFWAVEAGAKLWYFVLVAWLLFYVVIYWI